ncbi:MAG: cation:dicarboxylate symporter family transporter [Desulfonatronovibrio sp.]
MSSRSLIASVLLLAIFALTGQAWSMSGDLERLRAAGVLRVAIIDIDVPPFVFRVNGELRGADVDLARGFARSIGLEAEFVPAGESYAQVIQAVAEGRADIGISELSKTMERAQSVLFSRPYLISGITLFVNRLSEARLGSLRDRDAPEKDKGGRDDLLALLNSPRHVVAAMDGSIQDQLMLSYFPSAVLRTTRTWQEAAELVVAGEADAAIIPDRIHRLMVYHNPEVDYKARAVSLIPDPLVMAVHPDLPGLLRLINDYLDVTEHQRETSLAGLLERYLGHALTEPAQSGQDTELDPELMTHKDWPLLAAMHAGAVLLFWLLVIRRRRDKHWLLSPWAVVLAMVLGGTTGSLLASPVFFAGPLSELFIRFWQLCVLPIMITAVITSIYRLLVGGTDSRLVRRLVVVLPGALLSVALLGVFLGAWGKPGLDFPSHAQQVLIQNMPEVMEGAPRQDVFEKLMHMARSIVPGNVLAPVVHNQALAVLFIALFFGIMLARCRVEARQSVVNVLDAVQGVFTGMVRASLYLLPLALYLLTLDFTARVGTEMLGAIFGLTGLMALALVPPLIFGVVSLRIRLDFPFKVLVNRFLPMVVLAFSTRSSVVAMPLGMEALRGLTEGNCPDKSPGRQSGRRHGLDQDQTMAAFPLFLMACHCGFVIFFCLIPIFIGQVFQVEFTIAHYAFIVFGAALSALAATGSLAMSHVLLLPIICDPLGLPVEPAILVGYALLTIMSPFSAAVQTLFSSGLTAMVVSLPFKSCALPAK